MKNKWSYRYVKEIRNTPEFGQYLTYGLQVGRKTEEGYVLVECIHDITVKQQLAENLAEAFSRCQLSPIHFRDAVEDMLP